MRSQRILLGLRQAVGCKWGACQNEAMAMPVIAKTRKKQLGLRTAPLELKGAENRCRKRCYRMWQAGCFMDKAILVDAQLGAGLG
jgi:hypothetical protein